VNHGKKVLYITYYWPPSGGAGVQRSLKLVNNLVKMGWDVHVLTVATESATYPVLDESLAKEVRSEVKVTRTKSSEPLKLLSLLAGKKAVPYGGFTNSNKERWYQKVLRFVRGNFFVPDARVGWVRYAVKAAREILTSEEIDKIVISSPPHSSQLIGLALRKDFKELKWVADLRDPWTDIYYYPDLMHLPLVKKKDKIFELQVLEQCSSALVVSEPIATLFAAKSSTINPSKITVLPNGFDPADFPTGVWPPRDVFRITYVGTMADSYAPQVFFSSLSNLIEKNKQNRIQLRLIGSVSAGLRKLIHEMGLDEAVEMIGHVSHHEAVHYMCDSSLLLLLIPETKNAEGILTGKLFEYLGAGLPVLGIGPPHGAAAAILEQCRAGKIFDRQNQGPVEEFMQTLLQQWKLNPDLRHGSDVSQFDRTAQAARLSFILESLS
jgi:glycosyltransferase involved in cell wall biosynthesis